MLTAADTAYAIAFVRARESQRPAAERLFEDPYAHIFDEAGAHAREGTQRFIELPFFVDAVRLRTRAMDDVVVGALDAGLRQVVLLGAGFDMRGSRLPEIAGVGAAVFEIDFAAQLAKKTQVLTAAGVDVPAHVKHVPCDFGAPDFDVSLAQDLAAAGFRSGAGAVFLWEGVIAYIDAAAVDRTLRFVAHIGGPRTRLAFDFAPMAFDPPAEPRTRAAGFARFEQTSLDELWRRYLPGAPHPNASALFIGLAHVDAA